MSAFYMCKINDNIDNLINILLPILIKLFVIKYIFIGKKFYSICCGPQEF